jgi:hypothetical protein
MERACGILGGLAIFAKKKGGVWGLSMTWQQTPTDLHGGFDDIASGTSLSPQITHALSTRGSPAELQGFPRVQQREISVLDPEIIAPAESRRPGVFRARSATEVRRVRVEVRLWGAVFRGDGG